MVFLDRSFKFGGVMTVNRSSDRIEAVLSRPVAHTKTKIEGKDELVQVLRPRSDQSTVFDWVDDLSALILIPGRVS